MGDLWCNIPQQSSYYSNVLGNFLKALLRRLKFVILKRDIETKEKEEKALTSTRIQYYFTYIFLPIYEQSGLKMYNI